jgi:hypothetical protein
MGLFLSQRPLNIQEITARRFPQLHSDVLRIVYLTQSGCSSCFGSDGPDLIGRYG